MKTLLTLLIAAGVTTAGPTAPMVLGWDGVAPRYEVFRGIKKLADSTTMRATLTLPADSISTLTVVAVYATGERMTSAPFTVQPVRIQLSPDLLTWEDGPIFFRPHSPKIFLRAAFATL